MTQLSSPKTPGARAPPEERAKAPSPFPSSAGLLLRGYLLVQEHAELCQRAIPQLLGGLPFSGSVLLLEQSEAPPAGALSPAPWESSLLQTLLPNPPSSGHTYCFSLYLLSQFTDGSLDICIIHSFHIPDDGNHQTLMRVKSGFQLQINSTLYNSNSFDLGQGLPSPLSNYSM